MKRSNKGSIMLVALFVTLITGYLISTLIRSIVFELETADQNFYTGSVENLAQSGAEDAILALNENSWGGWSTNGTDRLKQFSSVSIGNGETGDLVVKVEDVLGTPTIISDATVALRSGKTIREQIQVELRERALFANGITAGDYLYFYYGNSYYNSVYIDSYDSSEGRYDARNNNNRNAGGTVAVEKIYNFSYYYSNIYIFGALALAPDFNPYYPVGRNGRVYGFDTPDYLDIDPDHMASDFTANFQDISAPSTNNILDPEDYETRSGNLRNINLGSGSVQQTYKVNGNFYIGSTSSWDYDEQTLNINGDVILIVTGSLQTTDYYGRIRINDPDGKLTLYVGNDLYLYGDGIINRTKNPDNLVVVSTATSDNQAYIYQQSSTTEWYGSIYGPRAYISWGDGSDQEYYGSMVGDRIVLRGNTEFHYDENLKNFDLGDPTYTVQEWSWVSPENIQTPTL